MEMSVEGLKVKVQLNEDRSNALVKDFTGIKFKMEMLENQVRATNLRLLNFPRSSLISARDMFKSYLLDVLGGPCRVPSSPY